MRYTVLLYPEEGGYSVLVPALPGCVTQGDTVEEALAMARDAIEGHVAALRDLDRYVSEEDAPPLIATVDVDVPASEETIVQPARAERQPVG
jgi:antitoxin HicB